MTTKEEIRPLVTSQQAALPSGSTELPIYKTYQDIRIKECKKVFNQTKRHKVVEVIKVPRAGMTTSMVIKLLQEGKSVLILEPTNEIINTTLYENLNRYDIDVIRVLSNKYCPINQERIKENQLLGKLPYMYLPMKCTDCDHFKTCHITEILRTNNPKVITSTYDKIISLMMSESTFNNTISEQILGKILSVDYIILDEIHKLAIPKDVRLEFANDYGHNYVHKLRKKLLNLKNNTGIDVTVIDRLLINYLRIIDSDIVLDTKLSLSYKIDYNHDSLYSEHFANPHQNMALCVNLVQNEDGTFSEPSELNDIDAAKEIYSKIIEISENIEHSDFSEKDITNICSMLSIIQADTLTIHSQRKVRTDENGKFLYAYKIHDICAIDKLHQELLRNFLYRYNKKIISTSATIGSNGFDDIMPYKPHKMMFGEGGDPLNTYSKMYVYADSKTFTNDKRSRYHIANMIDEIYNKCVSIFIAHGVDNCIIFCKNKNDFTLIKKLFDGSPFHPAITYYNSSQSIGVECDRRVGIALGLAYKPKHAFDYFTRTPEESAIVNTDSLHADTCQTHNRIKCPHAIDVSLLFILGARLEEVKACFLFGIDRQVEFVDGAKRVHCISPCKMPNFNFVKNWEETVIDSIIVRFSILEISQIVPHQEKLFGTSWEIGRKELKSISPLIVITSGGIQNANLQGDSGSGLLNLHTTGKTTLELNTLQSDNRTHFILYESEDKYTTKKLMLFLNGLKIPYILEKQRYSMKLDTYRIWVLIEPEDAFKVKKFALEILKVAGIPYYKNDKIRVYPQQTKLNKNNKGDIITMPFGKYSKILVDGEFVSVRNIDIGIITIPSTFEIEQLPIEKCDSISESATAI